MDVGAEVVPRARALREALAGLDPAVLSGQDCATVAEELARTEKACAAARARAAARATATGAHQQRGFADGADWLAAATGTTVGEARRDMEAARAVEGLAQTGEALGAGEVSLAQAAEVARGEAAVPGSEAALVGLAKRSGLGAVRDEARRLALGAARPEDLEDRQRRARHLRYWRDELGMVRLSGALPPQVGVGIVNRVEAEAARLRRSGAAEERFEAYAADALVGLLGNGQSRASRADLVVVCDRRAWARGHAHPGEPCHIVGGGPVTVGWARQMADDAFVKAVVHDGTDITTVAHFGRHMSAELRTALELGPPPGFDGVTCSEPGCERRYGLEWDHIEPVSRGGPTSYRNVQPLCKPHHWQKTERHRRAATTGQPSPGASDHGP